MVEPTEKELLRRVRKIDLRGRRVPPTIDGFERVAELGTDRLAQALIARHTLRMERIASAPARQRLYVMSALSPSATLCLGLVAVGADPARPPAIPQGSWQDHLLWGVDSAIAASRLLLSGQLVGAAMIVRHQLERWVLHRAHNAGLEQDAGESVAAFVARVWSIEEPFHARWFTELPLNPAFADEEEREELDEAIDHEHVLTSDGRVLCPGWTYCGLSELLHGRLLPGALQWDAGDLLDGRPWGRDAAEAVDLITAGITLALRQIRTALAYMAATNGDVALATTLRATLDSFSVDRPAVAGDAVRSTASRGVDAENAPSDGEESEIPRAPHFQTISDVYARRGVSPPLMSLAPLLPGEGLSEEVCREIAIAAGDFEAITRGERPAGRLFTDDELATLAFLWQRHRAIQCAQHAIAHERDMLGEAFELDGLTGRAQAWIILTEAASLFGRWAPSDERANAAALVGSGLRSAYWLWLEDDNRAMAVLRAILEQTARMRVWRLKPGKATELEARPNTTPRDWLENAGWRRLGPLNRALGEMAHTKPGSRWSGAHKLLAQLQRGADEGQAIYTARGAAIDFVASLVAAEVLASLEEVSPTLASAFEGLFGEVGIRVADAGSRDVQADFDHIWSQRIAELGAPDFARFDSAVIRYERSPLAKRRTNDPRRSDIASDVANPFIRPDRPARLRI
ncbi:hypothetical protein [Nocardioides montaniterrae]